jgi:hypothetical protein
MKPNKLDILRVDNSKAFKSKLNELKKFDKKIGRKEDSKERANIVLKLLELHDEELMNEFFLLGYKHGYKACKKLNKGKQNEN